MLEFADVDQITTYKFQRSCVLNQKVRVYKRNELIFRGGNQ